MSPHCTLEEIELYVQDKLEEPKRSRVRERIATCETCRRQYEECLENAALADQLRQVLNADSSPSASQADDFPEGLGTIEGYRLIREIHRGGQGVVYEAFQMATRRKVALKVLLGGSFAGPVSKHRFEREIELAANLNHPNIITIHDSGITRNNYFFVMDFVDGKRLDHYVAEHKLTLREKLKLFCKICDAVNSAHQRSVIHRDLKPSNILVDTEGEPFILDFGLARRVEDRDTSLSSDGLLLGTPQYIAPEQAEGKISQIDTRTDVYALGLILYKILTGTHPYPVDGRISDVLNNIVEAQPVRPSLLLKHLDSDIEVIVLKALAKEPNHRYQSAAELQRDIEFWLQGLPIVARSISSIYLLRKLITRHRYTSSVVGLLLIIVVGFTYTSFDLYRTAEASRIESLTLQKKLEDEQANLFTMQNNVMFNFFLQLWHADKCREACQVSLNMHQNDREGMACTFLLDSRPLAEKETIFRDRVGPDQAAFAEFVLGEYSFKQGDRESARDRFRKSEELLSHHTNESWLKMQVQSRLAQLSSLHTFEKTPPRKE